jgi:hypothetical protein
MQPSLNIVASPDPAAILRVEREGPAQPLRLHSLQGLPEQAAIEIIVPASKLQSILEN